MNLKLILELAIGMVALASASVLFLSKKKELAARKLGLAGNPKRCLQHEERMTAIEVLAAGVVGEYSARMSGLSKQIQMVGDDVQHLIRLHMKG